MITPEVVTELDRTVRVICACEKKPLTIVPQYTHYCHEYLLASTPTERRKITIKWKWRGLDADFLRYLARVTRRFDKYKEGS